jgi:hypothetical protein
MVTIEVIPYKCSQCIVDQDVGCVHSVHRTRLAIFHWETVLILRFSFLLLGRVLILESILLFVLERTGVINLVILYRL